MQGPWFAISFALYPPLFVAAANPGQVDTSSLVVVLACVVVASAALLATLRLVLKDWARAGLGVAWFVALFFSYGSVNAWYAGQGGDADTELLATGWVSDHLQLVHSGLWLLLLLLGWSWLRRRDRLPARLPATLNIVAGLLLAFALVQWLAASAGTSGSGAGGVAAATAREGDPDVYCIVLDGYARADMLAAHYGFDNSGFIQALERRGFQVAAASEANYSWTFLSLASTLNFDYLPALLEGEIDRASVDRQEAYRLLRDNAVASFLRSRGYRYVHLQSTWGGTGSNAYADDFLPCGGGFFRDEYLLAIAEISWLRVLGSTASIDLANCHLKNLETLKGLPQTQGPKFVLAHFVPPHHPYLFGRNGDVLRRANLSNQFEFQKRLWEDRRAYADQLAFMNDSIGSVVDRLIAESGRTPIIVLLSDHGPNIRRGLSADQHYGIRLATLSAVLVPGAPPGLVPQDLSNVNLFRLVFNEAFGAGMPLLPNRHFVSSFSQPFDFHEVRSDGTRLEPGSDAADNM